MAALPFKIGMLNRYELPSYERKGAVAHELFDPNIVLVKFSQTKTIIESSAGLPVMSLHSDVYKTIPRAGIKDTIVVGSVGGDAIWLLDVVSIEGNSVKGKSWRERLELLKNLCDGFSTKGVKVFPRAKVWNRGLMKAHKSVMDRGGAGLLVRLPAKTKAFIC